jgi:hypothetical protein
MIGLPLACHTVPVRRAVQTRPQIASGTDSGGWTIANLQFLSQDVPTGITSVARNDYCGNGYDHTDFVAAATISDHFAFSMSDVLGGGSPPYPKRYGSGTLGAGQRIFK